MEKVKYRIELINICISDLWEQAKEEGWDFIQNDGFYIEASLSFTIELPVYLSKNEMKYILKKICLDKSQEYANDIFTATINILDGEKYTELKKNFSITEENILGKYEYLEEGIEEISKTIKIETDEQKKKELQKKIGEIGSIELLDKRTEKDLKNDSNWVCTDPDNLQYRITENEKLYKFIEKIPNKKNLWFLSYIDLDEYSLEEKIESLGVRHKKIKELIDLGSDINEITAEYLFEDKLWWY